LPTAFPAGDKIYVERIVLKIKLTEKDYGMIGDLDASIILFSL